MRPRMRLLLPLPLPPGCLLPPAWRIVTARASELLRIQARWLCREPAQKPNVSHAFIRAPPAPDCEAQKVQMKQQATRGGMWVLPYCPADTAAAVGGGQCL